jgi:hypothetical protein
MTSVWAKSSLSFDSSGYLDVSHMPGHTDPSSYDQYYKAYSVAVMGGNERPELLYGGKSEPYV